MPRDLPGLTSEQNPRTDDATARRPFCVGSPTHWRCDPAPETRTAKSDPLGVERKVVIWPPTASFWLGGTRFSPVRRM